MSEIGGREPRWCCACAARWAFRAASGQDTADGPGAALAIQQAMVQAIARAERSVVAIARVRKERGGIAGQGGREALSWDRSVMGVPAALPTSPDFVPNEFATGVVLDRQGHILTNYHVLGDPQENDYYVWVQRRPFRATRVEVPEQVKAGDPWTDLAVLKVAATDLEPIVLGDASQLRKGMLVLALGNPYAIARDGEASASWGIVSNLRRAAPVGPAVNALQPDAQSLHQFGTLIQTDARLDRGTSGGALVNLKGEMVGLTTSLAALGGFEQPGGFAIPVDDAFRKTVETLKQGARRRTGSWVCSLNTCRWTNDGRAVWGRSFRMWCRVRQPRVPACGRRTSSRTSTVDLVTDKNALFRELSRLPARVPGPPDRGPARHAVEAAPPADVAGSAVEEIRRNSSAGFCPGVRPAVARAARGVRLRTATAMGHRGGSGGGPRGMRGGSGGRARYAGLAGRVAPRAVYQPRRIPTRDVAPGVLRRRGQTAASSAFAVDHRANGEPVVVVPPPAAE